MRLVVIALIVMLVVALGALEILAARGVGDADVPGDATVHTWTAR